MQCLATSTSPTALSAIAHRSMLPFLLVLLFATTGCTTTPKQTWHDWQLHDDGQRALPAASQGSVALTKPVALLAPHQLGDGAKAGAGFDLLMRNPDFPSTYIESIHLDLASPQHAIRVVWTGPLAAKGPVGPWRSCPGRGKPGVNCDDAETSNVVDSFCTPKGVFAVAGFSDHLNRATTCHYATWVLHAPRYVAMHSHADVAMQPRSEGCIRLPYEVAKLIHNNSKAGVTTIHIGGRWVRGAVDVP